MCVVLKGYLEGEARVVYGLVRLVVLPAHHIFLHSKFVLKNCFHHFLFLLCWITKEGVHIFIHFILVIKCEWGL